MKPDKPLAPLIRDIEYAMWNPKPPAFVGRPPEITHADMLYESCVPVNYDSDLENSNNFAWCPEDDFIECKVLHFIALFAVLMLPLSFFFSRFFLFSE
jgi:hypothetical protein